MCDSAEIDDSDPQQWLDRYGDVLFAFAQSRTGDRGLSEEMVQETLLAAIVSREHFRASSSRQSWLIGILRHKLADHFRRVARVHSLADLPSHATDVSVSSSPTQPDPGGQLEADEFESMLQRCLGELPRLLRQTIEFRAFDDLSVEEISNLMQVSRNHVAARLYRARKYLRRCLDSI